MRKRSAVILVQDGKIALMKRIRNGHTYYVFPGGGIEAGETPEQAAKREAFEELGLVIKITELMTSITHNSIQYYYLADIEGGVFGTGNGDEFTDKYRDRGIYIPMWVEMERLAQLDVRPKEMIPYIEDYFQI